MQMAMEIKSHETFVSLKTNFNTFVSHPCWGFILFFMAESAYFSDFFG